MADIKCVVKIATVKSKKSYKFGDCDNRMSIIKLNCNILRKMIIIVTLVFFIFLNNILQGSACEKILLFKSEFFAF
mgnify:FL=1